MTREEKKAARQAKREAKRGAKARKRAELDTETTVADMNVEGFGWYDPKRKRNANGQPVKLTRKEYWAMVRGAFLAMLPMLLCIIAGALLTFLLSYMWLK